MDTKKQEKMKQEQECLKSYIEMIQNIDEIQKALQTHTQKLVNKTFWQKHFKQSNEYRTWTTYNFSQPRYSFQNHNYELWLGVKNGDYIELQTRETQELKEKLQEHKEKCIEWAKQTKDRIAKLEKVDEKAIIADIRAVFNKHNEPSIWQELLKDFNVKYPNN